MLGRKCKVFARDVRSGGVLASGKQYASERVSAREEIKVRWRVGLIRILYCLWV